MKMDPAILQQVETTLTTQFLYPLIAWISLLVFELRAPIRKMNLGERAFHFKYTFITFNASLLLLVFSLQRFSPNLAKSLFSIPDLGLPVTNLSSRFSALPFARLARTLMILFASDVMFYWLHRAVHVIPILWPVHKLHHLDRRVNLLTTSLTHFFDTPLTIFSFNFLTLWVVSVIGPPGPSSGFVEDIFLFALLIRMQFWFAHANWKVRLGPLTRFVIGPQVHRIHHSMLEQHRNKNFASMFPIIDWIFGTYYHPAPDEWPDTGIEAEDPPQSQWAALMVPFRAWKEFFGQKS